MNAQHTPGPWAQAIHSPADIVVGDTQIASARYGLNGISRDQAIANARLIAAAPELLAALEAMLAKHDERACDGLSDLWAAEARAARAAIARVTR